MGISSGQARFEPLDSWSPLSSMVPLGTKAVASLDPGIAVVGK